MGAGSGTGGFRRAHLALVALLAVAAAGFWVEILAGGYRLEKKPIYAPEGRLLTTVTRETASWRQLGSDQVMPKDVVATLGTPNYVSRLYIEKDPPTGRPAHVINFHAAYYTGEIDAVPHVPERCFVGGGLQRAASAEVFGVPMDTSSWLADPSVERDFAGESGVIYTVRLPNRWSDAPGARVRLPEDVGPDAPFRMRVSEFSPPGDGRSLFAGYFFVGNGGTVANAESVKALAFDLRNEYAYYLKVQVTSDTVGSKRELAEVSGSLLGELIGDVLRCAPDWVEVQRGAYPAGDGGGEGEQA